MLKYILTILLINCYSSFSIDFNKYDFTPLLVNEDFKIEQIESNATGAIIVSGYNVINSNPQSYIANTVILKSIDNGLNWNIIYTDSNETLSSNERNLYNIQDLKYLDNGSILLFALSGKVLLSPDDGITWVKDSFGIFKTPIQVQFIDSQNGVSFWYKSFEKKINSLLYFTNDGGLTWEELNVPVIELLEYQTVFWTGGFFYFKDGTISFFMVDSHYENDSLIDSKSYLISTNDYGKTWNKEIFNVPVANSRIQFIDNQHIILFGILKSETHFDNLGNPYGHDIALESFDRGVSWDTLLINIDTNVNARLKVSFEYFDDNYFLIRGSKSDVIYFERGSKEISFLFPNNILDLRNNYKYEQIYDYIRFGDKILVSAGGGYLFYVDFKNPITSVKSETNEILTSSPYPQPANAEVRIDYTFSQDLRFNISNISIVDLLGKSLTNPIIRIENNSIIWDCSSAQSGVYIINIKHGTEEKSVKVIKE